VCVDCETSGPVPALYNLLSIGACALRARPDGGFDLGPELYVELKPVFPGFEPEAMRIHGLDRAALERDGLEPRDALERLRAFAESTCPAGHRPVFVGHNAPFDWMWIAFAFVHAGVKNPFGYSAIDAKALAMGLYGLEWRDTGKEHLYALLGIPPEDTSQKHRADYDARYQAEIFRALLVKHREVGRRERAAG
jgi:DNA polymerase III epsilon subunit-like protein